MRFSTLLSLVFVSMTCAACSSSEGSPAPVTTEVDTGVALDTQSEDTSVDTQPVVVADARDSAAPPTKETAPPGGCFGGSDPCDKCLADIVSSFASMKFAPPDGGSASVTVPVVLTTGKT